MTPEAYTKKVQTVMDNYRKKEVTVRTSPHKAYELGFMRAFNIMYKERENEKHQNCCRQDH